MVASAQPEKHDICLGMGSLYERLRRYPAVQYDPHIAHATLIYNPSAAETLRNVFCEYLNVGKRYGLKMQCGTTTWRAGLARCETSGLDVKQVNTDNVRFMRTLIDALDHPIELCAAMGPLGDAYRPEDAMETSAATEHHKPQADALAEAGVDRIGAFTMPAITEALGIARALASTDRTYIISFIVRSNGALLDGTPIADAVDRIDGGVDRVLTAYEINCVHPSVFREAMAQVRQTRPDVVRRFDGFQANTSSRTPEELDGLEELDTAEPDSFADAVVAVQREFSINHIAGCCGTSTAHMDAIAKRLARPKREDPDP